MPSAGVLGRAAGRILPTLMQILGVLLILRGCWLIAPWLCWLAAGLSVVLVGIALETRQGVMDGPSTTPERE